MLGWCVSSLDFKSIANMTPQAIWSLVALVFVFRLPETLKQLHAMQVECNKAVSKRDANAAKIRNLVDDTAGKRKVRSAS